MHKPAILVLADGLMMQGISVGAQGDCVGELVFNTSMTGYQEILTDPSYSKQIVMLTTAEVGNTGCNLEDMESRKAWASGLVVRECCFHPSNYRSQLSLPEWLKKQGVVAIAQVDTRQLTRHLREKGAMAACISTLTESCNLDEAYQLALNKARNFSGLAGLNLSFHASRKTIERWDEGQGSWSGQPSQPLQFHVVAYDFGIKHNLLRILHDKGCLVTVVPANTSVEEVLSLNPNGVFLSNGPGDPEACTDAISFTQSFLERDVPLFGICLGFQILCLSLGAKSKKMAFGHHGANHPVVEIKEPKRVFVTSQNHGFEIEEASLPDCMEATHRSLFDGSLQGIRHRSKPVLGFQGHPEASPGPHDIDLLFDEFIAMMRDTRFIQEEVL